MQISATNNFACYYQHSRPVTKSSNPAETALADNNQALKKTTTNENNATIISSGKAAAVVNSKSEINSGQPIQESSATKNGADKDMINKLSPDKPSLGDIAIDTSLSMVPVYGTVREFQKGNTGWGTFGAITDALTLIPVVGYAAKAIGSALHGGAVVAEAARGIATVTETARGAETITEATQAITQTQKELIKAYKQAELSGFSPLDKINQAARDAYSFTDIYS